ncbi:DUF4913 domain-containing protein [Nocardia sp. NPDC051756]|uniref:DUF4913 domain-containing protein n=1 Tax=Nocardia sp. NPDC051756 TaxID=3154751 RepID=UPI003430D97B
MSTTVSQNPNGGTDPADSAVQELGLALDAAVRKAVAAQVAAEAKDIAKDVVVGLLTPEVIAGMEATARAEAEAALAPADEEAQAQKQDHASLHFPTLDAFVEGYIAQLYRREVVTRGSDQKARWCPDWVLHGEAAARLQACWTAFEHLRLGDTTEQSELWIQHIDPHMDRLFSIDGPFKYCSVADGHSDELAALPVRAVGPGVCPDGHYEQRPSGLFVPSGPVSTRRVVWEFP